MAVGNVAGYHVEARYHDRVLNAVSGFRKTHGGAEGGLCFYWIVRGVMGVKDEDAGHPSDHVVVTETCGGP